MVSTNIDLKELERKAWRSVFQDGLWDIYLGLLLLAMPIPALLSDTGASKPWVYALYFGLLMLVMLALWAGKKYVTVPRMGRVKFGPKGKGRKKKIRLVLASSVLAGLVVFVLFLAVSRDPAQGLSMKLILPAVWAANMLVVFSLGAYFLEVDRLYLVGVMYALPVPVDITLKELAGIDPGFLAFGVPAAVILVTGLVLFVRFLRDYPVPAMEELR